MDLVNRASSRVAIVVAMLVTLLSGCNVADQYYEDVDNVGKQIVTDWKKLPEVADAAYTYRHGLDQGQILDLDVTLRDDTTSDEFVEQLLETARRNYWLGTPQSVVIQVYLYAASDPPKKEPNDGTNAIRQEKVTIDAAELEKKYGPGPTKK